MRIRIDVEDLGDPDGPPPPPPGGWTPPPPPPPPGGWTPPPPPPPPGGWPAPPARRRLRRGLLAGTAILLLALIGGGYVAGVQLLGWRNVVDGTRSAGSTSALEGLEAGVTLEALRTLEGAKVPRANCRFAQLATDPAATYSRIDDGQAAILTVACAAEHPPCKYVQNERQDPPVELAGPCVDRGGSADTSFVVLAEGSGFPRSVERGYRCGSSDVTAEPRRCWFVADRIAIEAVGRSDDQAQDRIAVMAEALREPEAYAAPALGARPASAQEAKGLCRSGGCDREHLVSTVDDRYALISYPDGQFAFAHAQRASSWINSATDTFVPGSTTCADLTADGKGVPPTAEVIDGFERSDLVEQDLAYDDPC